jgi:predicted nucleic acid-binding protein
VADVLVDTDVLIDHLRGSRRLRAGRDQLAYSVITRAELWAGSSAAHAPLGALLAPMRELDVDRQIAERAGRIRRQTGIGLADALIAATALVHDLELMTRNQRDFRRVSGIRLRLD